MVLRISILSRPQFADVLTQAVPVGPARWVTQAVPVGPGGSGPAAAAAPGPAGRAAGELAAAAAAVSDRRTRNRAVTVTAVP
jgi:hypothetical protein